MILPVVIRVIILDTIFAKAEVNALRNITVKFTTPIILLACPLIVICCVTIIYYFTNYICEQKPSDEQNSSRMKKEIGKRSAGRWTADLVKTIGAECRPAVSNQGT